MTSAVLNFKALHQADEPLLIGNVWNVQSARIYEKLGFKAIATSSAAVAETLGYADGEEMSFDEYRFIINRIAQSTRLPFSVDMEAGYGTNAGEIAENIQELYDLGVVGINLEDSVVYQGKRSIVDADHFSRTLEEIKNVLMKSRCDLFINVRCDTYLLGLPNATEESVNRIQAYEKSGVDGLFFPCITEETDIQTITRSTQLPVNVMFMPGLPSFPRLAELGVKRISMGGFPNNHAYADMEKVIRELMKSGDCSPLFQSKQG